MQANKLSAATSTQKRTHLVKDQLSLHDPRVLYERGLSFAGSELAQAGWPVIGTGNRVRKFGGGSFRKERKMSRWRRQRLWWPVGCQSGAGLDSVCERGDRGSPGIIFLFWLVTNG